MANAITTDRWTANCLVRPAKPRTLETVPDDEVLDEEFDEEELEEELDDEIPVEDGTR